MMSSKDVTENGVTIHVQGDHDKPGKCKTFYNPVMKICREFVLCGVAAMCEDPSQTQHPIKCLDAFGATGIGGLQWKHHLKQKVQVTINEASTQSVQEIKENCTRNGLTVDKQSASKTKSDEGDASAHSPGGSTSSDGHQVVPQVQPESVEVVEADANVTLHQRQFNFIHLDPYGSTVQFLDAAFRNIYNRGVMVITSTDVAALYGKVAQVTQRSYNGYTVKTDYMKELAARLVLAAAVRAAARCNKGVQVLYSVAVEHFVQVAVKICRGPSHADQCLTQVRRVLHCQMCEEWAVYPDSKAPIEDPYGLLDCDCHEKNPGKTAVELGPLWVGELFETTFLKEMKKQSCTLKLSEKLQNLLNTMIKESECSCGETNENKNGQIDESSSAGGHQMKRKLGRVEDPDVCLKRLRSMREIPSHAMPPFYYNIHRRQFKKIDLPKFQKIINMLHEAKFRASRTHFDPLGIRTNATLRQLTQLLDKHYEETQTKKDNQDQVKKTD